MVARLTSIVIRYQKVAVSSTVTLILFVDFISISAGVCACGFGLGITRVIPRPQLFLTSIFENSSVRIVCAEGHGALHPAKQPQFSFCGTPRKSYCRAGALTTNANCNFQSGSPSLWRASKPWISENFCIATQHLTNPATPRSASTIISMNIIQAKKAMEGSPCHR